MRLLRYLALGLLVATGAASAQSYPDKSKPLKIIVPFGAASSTDTLARALGRGIAEVSGLNVVIDNRPGAEGVIGVQAAKTASPDGYTLLLTSNSTQVLNVHMQTNLPYDPIADFVPLTSVAKFSIVMNAGPTVTQRTAREFIESARANPGKYTFGSGTATTRLAGELLQQLAGIKLLSVPYKSLALAMTDLAGGQVDIVITDLSSADPHYRSGRVRPMAVTGTTRMSARPELPTLREEGVADYDVSGWWATYFPARTPPATAAAMREILQKAVKTSYVTDVLSTFALEPMQLGGEELSAFQQSETVRWGKLIRSVNAVRPQ